MTLMMRSTTQRQGAVWRRLAWAAPLAAVLLGPRTSAACFDEHVARVDAVCISIAVMSESSPLACGISCATWAMRVGRLLPRGARLSVNAGWQSSACRIERQPSVVEHETDVELCLAGRGCTVWPTDERDVAGIFDDIAARLATPPARRARARRVTPSYFTLQVGSFASEAGAKALAWQINSSSAIGADVSQGHPGANNSAWVETHSGPGGRTVYRVLAGSFPGYAYARRDRVLLEQWTREPPLVRPASEK